MVFSGFPLTCRAIEANTEENRGDEESEDVQS
jgi:hypothetical protein